VRKMKSAAAGRPSAAGAAQQGEEPDKPQQRVRQQEQGGEAREQVQGGDAREREQQEQLQALAAPSVLSAQNLQSRTLGLVRRYMGEQVAEQLLRAQVDAAAKVDGLANELRERVHASGLGGLGELQDAGKRRELFEQLFSGRAAAPGGSPRSTSTAELQQEEESQARLWCERSASWLDVMQPQGRIWFGLALPSSLLGETADLSWALDEALRLDEELEHQLELDLPRTFPQIELFEDPSVMTTLRKALRGAALSCPEVGYVQGMNFLGAYLVLHCKSEHETLRLLVELLTNPRYDLRGVFEEGLPTLRKLAAALKAVLTEHSPRVSAHLDAQGFGELFFSFQWLSTLFAYSMPFDALEKVWDHFFAAGWPGFFQLAVVLINDREKELLQGDFDGVCATLRACAANPREDFFSRAEKVRLSAALLSTIKAAAQH
jgi:hypothetical protein